MVHMVVMPPRQGKILHAMVSEYLGGCGMQVA